jgi:hypothetical protein
MDFTTNNSYNYKDVTSSITGDIIVNYNNGSGGSNHVIVTGGNVIGHN